jgi:serine/threonine protein phosphatase PrpC
VGEVFEFGGHSFAASPEEAPEVEETSFPRGVRIDAGYCSAKGPEQEVNQDSILALTLAPVFEGRPAPALGLYALADGLGGYDTGEVASSLAIQIVAQEVISCIVLAELNGEICLVETLLEILEDAVQAANAQVHAVAQAGGVDMGSTVVVVLVRDDLAVVASVGDSRVYHWRDGALVQVTMDHSVVQRLLAMGQVESQEVATHPQRGVLYRSLGDRPTIEVDLFSLSLAPGDRLLLCCDGVWRSLREGEIEDALLLEQVPQKVCDLVTRRALDSGAEDNVSAVVVGLMDC